MAATTDNQTPRIPLLIGLAIAQCFGSFGQITMATLSGIVGSILAPEPQFSTLPVTLGIVGVASAAWPLATLRQSFGSRRVFAVALLWASAGACLAAYAISSSWFAGFCIANFMLGNNMAVIAQYRFTAAELVPRAMASRAISAVMLGTLVAAMIAPWLALEYRALLTVDFAGSFMILVGFYLLTALLVFVLALPERPAVGPQVLFGPSIGEILRRRPVAAAIIAAAGGYAVMSLLMTATPISMHLMDEHSADMTADVIRAHILAMFAPSLFSGWLIDRIGVSRMLWSGVLLQCVCIAIAVSGTDVWHYQLALIALGAGWNFLYVGGTSWLAQACSPEELGRIQGMNDMLMFCAMAVASLSAGGLLYSVGWQWTNGLALVLLVLIAFFLLRVGRSAPH